MALTRKFRKSAFLTLVLSIPALLVVCSAVVGFAGTFRFVGQWPLQIVAAFVCMSGFIWITAPAVAAFCGRHFLIMGCYFVVVFLIGAVSGSAASMLLYRENSFGDYILKPVYWLSVFGIAPAFVLGVIGAAIYKRHEDASEPDGPGNSHRTD